MANKQILIIVCFEMLNMRVFWIIYNLKMILKIFYIRLRLYQILSFYLANNLLLDLLPNQNKNSNQPKHKLKEYANLQREL